MESKKILLVEDDDLIRELYARQLTKAGLWVKAVATGEEGLEELGKETFELLLLDIMLPGMNGLQMLKQYKTKNPKSDMKIVLLTNLGQESIIKEGFDMGAQAYLIKASYSPEQVVEEVKNVLVGTAAPQTPP